MKQLKVKFCGIKTAEQAQMVLSYGADYVGVNLWHDTPRCTELSAVPAVLEAVPNGCRVMVDVMPDSAKLALADKLGFDFFQIHFPFDTEPKHLSEWADVVGKDRLWLAPKLPSGQEFPKSLLCYADTIVVDAYRKDAFGGTGKIADWSRFKGLKSVYSDKRWLLAGGLSPENISMAVKESSADFVDVNSGTESAPGVKDEALVRALFEALSGS